MTEKQYRLNKWGTMLLKNNRPLFDWTNESDEIVDMLNELNDKNEQLKKSVKRQQDSNNECAKLIKEQQKENEQLKEQIKDLRINVLDNIHEADEIQCNCNPCVVEKCVKKVVE